MLEQFFDDPAAVARLAGGPLGPHLHAFAASLATLGYATSTARAQIEFLGEFGQWLVDTQVGVAGIDEPRVHTFFDERRRQGRLRGGQRSTLQRVLDHLRMGGAVPTREPATQTTPVAILEGHYERYLRTVRGLTPATVVHYLFFVRRFLVERFGSDELRLRDVGPSDISSFMLQHTPPMSPGRAQLMVTAVRSFFRFLLQGGDIDVDLAASVPTVAHWRLSSVPKHLTPAEVDGVLGACTQDTSIGRRDYAILLLLARLGLRASEVRALQLDDIDWRAGEILVRGKGRAHDRMPLPMDVGHAVATYLRRDRPRCASRRIFIRMRAPWWGLAHPSTVSTIVRRAVERAGLDPVVKGAHLLRHSLATGMLRQGGSLAEIGEILRHRVPTSTEIYAKVDVDGLRGLSLPWPETGGEQ